MRYRKLNGLAVILKPSGRTVRLLSYNNFSRLEKRYTLEAEKQRGRS